MVTVRDLVAASKMHRPVLVSNAGRVSIYFGGVRFGKDGKGYYKSVAGSARANGPNKKTRRFEIRLYYPKDSGYVPENLQQASYQGPEEAPPFTAETEAWVTCTCEYFLYHCEVADTRKGSSSIRHSNGASPRITNPQQIPHVCKHLISALRKGALVKK